MAGTNPTSRLEVVSRMSDTNSCLSCGTALPNGAQFCPKCGLEVSAPVHTIRSRPATPPPPVVPEATAARVVPGPIPIDAPERQWVSAEPDRTRAWMIAAAVIVAVVGIAIALLIAAPFGADEKLERRTVETDTIGEGPSPQGRPSLGVDEAPPATTATSPPVTATTATTVTVPTAESPSPAPGPTPSRPSADDGAVSVREDDAIAIVRGAALNYYNGVAGDCQDVRSEGFINVGYTMAVVDRCSGGSELGRWRVDARNGDVFRQQGDGRYVKP